MQATHVQSSSTLPMQGAWHFELFRQLVQDNDAFEAAAGDFVNSKDFTHTKKKLTINSTNTTRIFDNTAVGWQALASHQSNFLQRGLSAAILLARCRLIQAAFLHYPINSFNKTYHIKYIQTEK